MLSFFARSRSRSASQKLTSIGIGPGKQSIVPSFRRLATFVASEVHKKQTLDHYLTAMNQTQITANCILKYGIFLHIVFQEKAESSRPKIVAFLKELMSCCQQMIADYSAKSKREQIHKSQPEVILQTPEDNGVCKQYFLLSAVVSPYLAYLMRITCGDDDLGAEKHGEMLEAHQAWKMINLLRMITSISVHFTMIGRYYIKAYGQLIVLLIRTLSRDIHRFISLLAGFVDNKQKLAVLGTLGPVQICELVEILEEVCKLNEKLLILYLGKYFFAEVKDLAEPPWIIPGSSQFDRLYKLYETLRKSEGSMHKDTRQK